MPYSSSAVTDKTPRPLIQQTGFPSAENRDEVRATFFLCCNHGRQPTPLGSESRPSPSLGRPFTCSSIHPFGDDNRSHQLLKGYASFSGNELKLDIVLVVQCLHELSRGHRLLDPPVVSKE